MNYLRREKYLSRIRPFIHDEGLIKVLTGVRRCGKSTVLEQIRDEILSEGITKENVIHLNLDPELDSCMFAAVFLVPFRSWNAGYSVP